MINSKKTGDMYNQCGISTRKTVYALYPVVNKPRSLAEYRRYFFTTQHPDLLSPPRSNLLPTLIMLISRQSAWVFSSNAPLNRRNLTVFYFPPADCFAGWGNNGCLGPCKSFRPGPKKEKWCSQRKNYNIVKSREKEGIFRIFLLQTFYN